MMRTEFIFIRHGQSTANVEDAFAGHIDAPLTDLGREQAHRTAKLLCSAPIDAFICSDLCRAYETAQIIAAPHGLTVEKEPMLRELYMGDLDGMKLDCVLAQYPDFIRMWSEDFSRVACPNGESVQELVERAEAVMAFLLERYAGKRVAVVCHAAILRALHCVWRGEDYRCIHAIPWATNASASFVSYHDGAYDIEQYSYDVHLADIRTCVREK